ncbi:hypothetical protein A2U01_0016511, partial [Trifolium medium]|nr:hypothetical protein [Trifolium medium]
LIRIIYGTTTMNSNRYTTYISFPTLDPCRWQHRSHDYSVMASLTRKSLRHQRNLERPTVLR